MSATDFYNTLAAVMVGASLPEMRNVLLGQSDVLTAYVGASADDAEYVTFCWDTATNLVLDFIGSKSVPAHAIGRAVVEVGSELFHRRSAPNGVAQFTTFDGSAIRIARDPMVGAYPILRRYVGFGMA